jgi:hypothetical protein
MIGAPAAPREQEARSKTRVVKGQERKEEEVASSFREDNV